MKFFQAIHKMRRMVSQLIRYLRHWVYTRRYYDASTLRVVRQYGAEFFSETRARADLSGFDIGAWTYGTPTVHYQSYSDSMLKIGKFCSIAPDVRIFLAGEHQIHAVSTYPFRDMFADGQTLSRKNGSKGDVSIGNDVWIGYGTLVLSGVRIGDGAVVAARSVVTKDVQPYAVVGGVPAKIIRMRFTPEEVDALLRIAWWDWPIEKINRELKTLLDDDVSGFIAAFDK